MRLALLVPFRDRYNHLREFIPHYTRRFKDANIFIGEQADDKPFNRAKILNSLFLHFQNEFDYFAAHDVDLLCTKGDYSYCEHPTQLATHAEQFRYKMPFPEYFGGVTLFNNKDFVFCNGFSNEFKGYGGEDEEMYSNVLKCGLKISYRDCYYRSLHHTRKIDPILHAKNVSLVKNGRGKNDGLTHCKYEIVGVEEHPQYTKLKVIL